MLLFIIAAVIAIVLMLNYMSFRHFKRWDFSRDRKYALSSQTKNVLVHKFVCRGTVEDKIDELIESKRQLSTDLLEGGADLLLTEMKDEDLLKLVALDINKALKEA